jgi:hypothetical protein
MQGGRSTVVENESETSVPFVNDRGEGKRRGTEALQCISQAVKTINSLHISLSEHREKPSAI